MGDIMINKQGLIFLTLTSLILVLSVYYVTMPNELLLTTNSSYLNEEKIVKSNVDETKEDVKVTLEEGSVIGAMRSLLNDERLKEIGALNEKLTQKELTVSEKNNVYEELKDINKIEVMEQSIEKMIKKELNLDSFVKIKDDVIEIVINSEKHDTKLVVKIMNLIEQEYKNMYISVSFKK